MRNAHFLFVLLGLIALGCAKNPEQQPIKPLGGDETTVTGDGRTTTAPGGQGSGATGTGGTGAGEPSPDGK